MVNSKSLFSVKWDLKSFIGIGLSLLLLWITINKSGLQLENITFNGRQLIYFLLAIFTLVISIWFYAQRATFIWRANNMETLKLNTLSSLFIGLLYNSILPGNLGEGIRAFHFAKKTGVSFVKSLSAILTEKWLDAQVFSFLSVFIILNSAFRYHFISISILTISATVVVLSILYVIFQKYRSVERFVWLNVIQLKFIGVYLYKMYRNVCQFIKNMQNSNGLYWFVLYFAVIFLLNILQIYFLLLAANINAPLNSFYSCFTIALSMMVIAFIPAAPSSIGVLHYGLYTVLIYLAEVYGVQSNTNDLKNYALFSVYFHLSYFLPEVLIGLVFLIKEGSYIWEKR